MAIALVSFPCSSDHVVYPSCLLLREVILTTETFVYCSEAYAKGELLVLATISASCAGSIFVPRQGFGKSCAMRKRTLPTRRIPLSRIWYMIWRYPGPLLLHPADSFIRGYFGCHSTTS